MINLNSFISLPTFSLTHTKPPLIARLGFEVDFRKGLLENARVGTNSIWWIHLNNVEYFGVLNYHLSTVELFTILVFCMQLIYVTSFSSISYWSNSEYWSQKHTQSGNIHFILFIVKTEECFATSSLNLQVYHHLLNDRINHDFLNLTIEALKLKCKN